MADLKPPALAPARSSGAHLSPWPPPSMHFLVAVSSLSPLLSSRPGVGVWAEWGACHLEALGPALGQVALEEPGSSRSGPGAVDGVAPASAWFSHSQLCGLCQTLNLSAPLSRLCQTGS